MRRIAIATWKGILFFFGLPDPYFEPDPEEDDF